MDEPERDTELPPHHGLHGHDPRNTGSEGAIPAPDGYRREARRHLHHRAQCGQRRPGHRDSRRPRRRRIRGQRDQEPDHQRAPRQYLRPGHQDRPERRPAPARHQHLHRREGAGLQRGAGHTEAGLQGRRYLRAVLRGLPRIRRESGQRRGRARGSTR